MQWVRNVGYASATHMRSAIRQITHPGRCVKFDLTKTETHTYWDDNVPARTVQQEWQQGLPILRQLKNQLWALYDSGADSNYITEDDRKEANLPIIKKSTAKVGVCQRTPHGPRHSTISNSRQSASASSPMMTTYRYLQRKG